MSSPQSLLSLLRLKFLVPDGATKSEIRLLEAEITAHLVDELMDFFESKYCAKNGLYKTGKKGESVMLDVNFLKEMLRDILITGEYTLDGVVSYTGYHEDTIHAVAAGLNANPSFSLFYRFVELHRFARRDLYEVLRKKICLRLLQSEDKVSDLNIEIYA